MVKAAIKNKEIDKRAPLDEKEAQQVLATLIKQRRTIKTIEALVDTVRRQQSTYPAA